ncbi:hypothetical protein ACFMQL_02555 [Nonomuraea fastidiosa]|uniref:hypothetical protein n=1 Tax=Nonomuraea fastidiosa TaxID=46173 RepID=UPI0036725791
MGIVIGVVGPHDLVDDVAAVCEEQPGVTTLRLDYDHESEAPAIVEAHAASVEGWLFTGIVPYMLSRDADALTRPAAFVDYSGATLLSALVRLQRQGEDVTRLSIDTLPTADVNATFTEAGLPTAELRVLPYRPGMTSKKAIAFHRKGPPHAVITCLSSVHEALRDELHVLRLVPSVHSVRVALRQLMLTAEGQAQEDAQIALGLIEVANAEGLLREATALGGTLAAFRGGTHLLVTTRGPLHDATGGFTGLAMLARLAGQNDVVHVGFGLGRSAAEAESLARRALARARRIGDVAAVLSLRADTDIVLESATASAPAWHARPAGHRPPRRAVGVHPGEAPGGAGGGRGRAADDPRDRRPARRPAAHGPAHAAPAGARGPGRTHGQPDQRLQRPPADLVPPHPLTRHPARPART